MAGYIVILSNGLSSEATFYGPFPDHDSALEWAEAEAGALAWEIAPLTDPTAA
jgi:hypothetical protein